MEFIAPSVSPEFSGNAKENGGKISSAEPAFSSRDLVIVRLKRKRGEEPLDAFVVQKILNENNRINKKLKRLDEQLAVETNGIEEKEHFVTEDLSQAPTINTTIFRFAETVDEMTFENSAQTRQLKERLRGLMNRAEDPNAFDKYRNKQFLQFQRDTQIARYKVINQNRKTGPDLEQYGIDQENITSESFQIYDAIKNETDNMTSEELDPQEKNDAVDKLMPLIRDYLSLHEIPDEDHKQATDSSKDEYVYDVFYLDDEAAMTSDFSPEKFRNVASLTWLDEGDNTRYDSGSDDLIDEDEDSNAENYYTHDYPDEEEQEEWTDEDDAKRLSEEEDYYY
ncbi:hypothetical protein G9A89_016120 [Geosiphon pyriformis]|nr:hypothetical protein G9A89_016120 [Geosiphon pyriformis]